MVRFSGWYPSPVYRGTALITITVGHGKKKIRFADSNLFVQGALASYPAVFGLQEALLRGYVPILFKNL